MIQEIILVVMAPFVGSFLGVLVTRLPDEREWRWSRSTCDNCHAILGPAELVPILSWLVFRGRCRHCQAEIGTFHPAIELAALAIVLWTLAVMPGKLQIVTALFGWLLLTLAVLDWRVRRLPDVLTLTLGAAGLAAAYLYDHENWLFHAVAGFAGGVILLAVAVVYRRLRHQIGLGFGDAKLLAALGTWVSLSGLPSVLFLGALFALVFYIVRRTFVHADWREHLPFGPFLAAAGWLVWCYGPLVPAWGH